MSGYAKRLLGVLAVALAFAAGIVVYVVLFLTSVPGSTAATQTVSGLACSSRPSQPPS